MVYATNSSLISTLKAFCVQAGHSTFVINLFNCTFFGMLNHLSKTANGRDVFETFIRMERSARVLAVCK